MLLSCPVLCALVSSVRVRALCLTVRSVRSRVGGSVTADRAAADEEPLSRAFENVRMNRTQSTKQQREREK